MKYAMFYVVVTLFCLQQVAAQTAYFNAPADKSIHEPGETINVSFNITADADSVKLLLKGAGSQRFLDLSLDGDYSTEIGELLAGNYKLYAYVFNANLYTVSTLQFSIVNGCCAVRTFADSAAGDVIDNDNGWELDMSNYDFNPYTFGFLKYNSIGETSVASITNKDSASVSVSNLSTLQLASLNDQSFSLFSSSNDLTKGRYGSAGIYGYATSDYENGGSGLSYEVSDSSGTSTIEQYSSGIDVTAKNFNVSSDTVFVNSNNILFSSQPIINGGLGLGEYSFSNGLSQEGSNVGLGGVGGFLAYYLPEDVDEGLPNGEIHYNSGDWVMTSLKQTDTSYQESGLEFENVTDGNYQTFIMFADDGSLNTTYSNANISGYAGSDGVGISINASDSTSHNENNGIQVYATGIDLNARNVQLNYYPNNSDSSLILATDALGNIVQRPFSSFESGSGYIDGGLFVGNGLMYNGSEIDLGGSNGFDAAYLSNDYSSNNAMGELFYDNISTGWGMRANQSNDSVLQNAYLLMNIDGSGSGTLNYQAFDLSVGNKLYYPYSRSHAQVNGYTGYGGAGLSLTVSDSLGAEDNGIQIYDTGIDLNSPNIQLNYFPNSSSNDLILSTDSAGNLTQKPFGSFFDAYGGVPGDLVAAGTGLTYDGTSLGLGGTSGFDAIYVGTDVSNTGYGEFNYDNVNNSWGLNINGQDSTNFQAAGLNFNITPSGSANSFAQQFDLFVGGTHHLLDSISASEVYVYAGDDGPGISLSVHDASTAIKNNGIQIYDNGIDLNAPLIQLNMLPNTPSMDSVLVTDSLGYLKQRAIASFTNGHWYLSGNTTYDLGDSIGIGTNTPQSKLAVNGTVTALKVKVTQSGWPDYVFDSAYSLTSLKDLEKYLQENKHLPEITAAVDIEKNGLDLGDNQAALLKKVEELTLYIIKQNKEIEELKAQANKLKALEDKVNALISK